MKIVFPLNSVRLELKSASESIQPVLIIWVGLIKSDWIQLMKYTVTEPGLLEIKTTIALPFRSRLVRLTTWIVRLRQKNLPKSVLHFQSFFFFASLLTGPFLHKTILDIQLFLSEPTIIDWKRATKTTVGQVPIERLVSAEN